MANKLRLGKRMLSLGEPRKVLIAYRTGQPPLFSKFALPLAMPLLVPAPVILALRGELPLMVGANLTR